MVPRSSALADGSVYERARTLTQPSPPSHSSGHDVVDRAHLSLVVLELHARRRLNRRIALADKRLRQLHDELLRRERPGALGDVRAVVAAVVDDDLAGGKIA